MATNDATIAGEIKDALITKKANACPMAVRLAWHASGTFDKADSSGGSDGATMRFEPESTDGANAGLSIISDLLLDVKKKNPDVSFADLWTRAGAAAVQLTGGPKIPFSFGRTDDADNTNTPANGRLPDASQGAEHLRDVFYRMGFNDQEIVALSGAHTLGRCHLARSGFDGPWTHNPLRFDNEYFRNLINLTWVESKRTGEGGPLQYEDQETTELIMLPTDLALIKDPAFLPHVERYAKDEQAFFSEFAVAFAKLLALGTAEKCPFAKAEVDHSAEFREQAMHGSLAKVTEIAAKADVKATEAGSDRTALHKAAFWGHDHLMPILIDHCGIDVNAVDYNGDTAAHDAAKFGHVKVVEALIAAKANLGLTNKAGQTVLDLAQAHGKTNVADIISKL